MSDLNRPTNVLICGVGGQGTILASRILAAVCCASGAEVKISEIHGMSQRGGSVMTQVRFGSYVASPVIEPGTADIALCFEKLEALRTLPWMRDGGKMIVSDQELYPMPVITGAAAYPKDIESQVRLRIPDAVFTDALALAKQAGNIKAVNVVLLGLFSRYLPFSRDQWRQAISDTVKPKTVDINLKAFDLGAQA